MDQLRVGVRRREALLLLRRADYPNGRIPFEHVEAALAVTGGTPVAITDEELEQGA